MIVDDPSLANDLITLSGTSMSKIARAAELTPANLSTWLRGSKASLGRDAKNRLFLTLGVMSGTLNPHTVHFWALKSPDLDPFYRILESNGQPVEIFHVAPQKQGLEKYLPDKYLLPLVARNADVRVFLRRRISAFDFDVPSVDVSKLPEGSYWRPLPPDSYYKLNVLRIPNTAFDHAFEKNLSMEEFDQLFPLKRVATAPSRSTWESVYHIFEEKGFTPETAIKWIKTNLEKKQ